MTFEMNHSLAEISPDITQPLLILPAQFFNSPDISTPERGLMRAVLGDALRCIEKYRFQKDERAVQEFDEAQNWLYADEPDWPYSFEHICDVLALDANAVRERLRLVPRANAEHRGDRQRRDPLSQFQVVSP